MLVNEKRLFIAVDIDEALRDDIRDQAYQKEGLGNMRWVRPQNLHLTLKFLGNVKSGDIDRVTAVMDSAAEGRHAITLTYTGMGVFPGLSRPRVLWLGFSDPDGSLQSIAAAVDDGLFCALDIAKDKRPFVPHLTVARIKGRVDKRGLEGFVKEGLQLTNETFSVSEVILYESVLKKSGAEYSRVYASSLESTGG